MIRKPPIAGLGDVMQLAFVPSNIDAALAFWTKTMGIGPFFTLSHVKLDEVHYRGLPADIDFSMWLAYWGDTQIELITQHNDAPSIFKTWRDAGHEGLHHVCVLVDDFPAARAICAEAGASILQEAKVPGGGEVIYADAGGGQGTMLEVLKLAPGGRELFAFMKDAARDWDGTEPVRAVG